MSIINNPFEWSSKEVQHWLKTVDNGAYLDVAFKFVGLPGAIFFGFTKDDLKDEKLLGPVMGLALFNAMEKLFTTLSEDPPPLYDEINVPNATIIRTINQPPNYEMTAVPSTTTIVTISSPDIIEETYSPRSVKNYYIILSVFNLIGVIGVIFTSYNYNLVENEYIVVKISFLLFGLICIIYTLYCLIRGQYLNEMFTVFAFIALSGAGAVLNSFDLISYPFIFALCFSISTLILIRIKNRTDNYVPTKSPEKFYNILIMASLSSMIGVIIALSGNIYIVAIQFYSIGNLVPNFLFCLFGLIIGYYGIVCGKNKNLSYCYSDYLPVVVLFCGIELFFFRI